LLNLTNRLHERGDVGEAAPRRFGQDHDCRITHVFVLRSSLGLVSLRN
jgi:hypothetical protein